MAKEDALTISPAEYPRDRDFVVELFLAYAKSLGIDLSYQSFEEELSQLPGKYATENGGALFLASTSRPSQTTSDSISQQSSKCIGCVAVRPFTAPRTCELKRLYITPDARGLGAGRLLLEAAIAKAKELGYKEMLLDSLSSMVPARKLYAQYGFQEVEKYYDSPIEGTVFMKAAL